MKLSADASIDELRAYCAALEKEVATLTSQKDQLEGRLSWLEEQFRLAQKRRFGSSSERTHDDQLALVFDEAEAIAQPELAEPTYERVKEHRRKARKSRADALKDLPVERREYRLADDERQCPHCDGTLHEMSTQIRRELEIIPAQVRVIEHVQHVYSCRHCERNDTTTPIQTAKMPAPPLPGSLASPSILAHIITQKYVDGLPLYRQEQQLKRLGTEISRQNLANWILNGTNRWLTPLYELMRSHLLQREILHADETPVQVLKEPGRPAESKSYMWLYRSGRDGPPVSIFEYQPTRAGEHPRAFLSEFKGYLHVDAYQGYRHLKGVHLVGCWAHVRRGFMDALKALPSSKRSRGPKDPSPTEVGLEYCNRIFRAEKALKDMDPERRRALRQTEIRPLLDAFKAWLDEQEPRVLPKSALGQAVNYALRQWPKLLVFLEDGRLELSNNRAERTIKPFVIGRKAWLFANVPRGAQASAIAYSLAETAKENGLRPFAYFTYLFEQLPNIDLKDDAALDVLLPWSDTLPDACRMRSSKKAP